MAKKKKRKRRRQTSQPFGPEFFVELIRLLQGPVQYYKKGKRAGKK